MTQRTEAAPLLAFSARLYDALLVAYPTRFRQKYGAEMSQVFRDCCRRAFHQNGKNGLLRLWAVTLLDFLRSVFEQHMQKETGMSKSELIKLSGWGFVLGGFAFTVGYVADSWVISLISSILLAVGMLGLRSRYGRDAVGFGRTILLSGVVAMFLPYLALGLVTIADIWFWPALPIDALYNRGLWLLLYAGPAILLTALALFGLAALRWRPMTRLNWLPVLAGIWYPGVFLFVAAYVFTRHAYPWWYQGFFNMMALIQFIPLFVLGLSLASQTPREMAPA